MFKHQRFEDLKNWKQPEQVWDRVHHSDMHAHKIARSYACWAVGCAWQAHECHGLRTAALNGVVECARP